MATANIYLCKSATDLSAWIQAIDIHIKPNMIDTLYVTFICVQTQTKPDDYNVTYPLDDLKWFSLESVLPDGRLKWIRAAYPQRHSEYAYLDEVENVIQDGEVRDDRTGVGTKAIFGSQVRFDISDSVPILTTKQMAWKTVLRELLFFIRGNTDTKLLESEGVKIWRGNTSREFLDKSNLTEYAEGDMGPMYGFNWRHFGATYTTAQDDYSGEGVDQLVALIDGLKTDPFSRRHIMTTYDPSTVNKCVLYPCHGLTLQMYVSNDRELSCHVYCRSQDEFLGKPFNQLSYGIFTHIIAKLVGMLPKELIISSGDTHIYKNHMEQVAEQLKRPPLPLPRLLISDSILNKPLNEITVDDFTLSGYVSHPPISAPMAV